MNAMKWNRSGRSALSLCAVALLVMGTGALSWAQGVPWLDHAAPYTFTFGNHIDTHQQSKLVRGQLQGFIYITYTGEVLNGVPIAGHCDDGTIPTDCVVGWNFAGRRASSGSEPTFAFHQDDHPIWLVESRKDIPQPGAYSHFHWLGAPQDPAGLAPGSPYPGYFLELFATQTFYFEHEGQIILVRPGLDIATHVNIVASFP
jgi:hypothetical protein